MSTIDIQKQTMIRSISIENFRGIRKLDLQFETPKGDPSPIVVLAGPNGCGKTAVIEACLIAAGHANKVRGSRGKTAIRNGADDYLIQTEFSIDGEAFTVNHHSEKSNFKRWPCLYFSSMRSQTLVRALGVTAGSSRSPEANGTHDVKKKPAERDRLVRIKQYLINAWAHGFTSDSVALPRYVNAIGPIQQIWSLFYPTDRRIFRIDSIGQDVEQGFNVFLQDLDRKQIGLPVDDLSSGQLELFCLAGTPAIEKFDRGLVIVDELELHLDPQWHRLMLQAMRILFPGSQLIVTTHSPAIYESVLSFERHFLIPESDPRARIWSQPLTPDE